jgi:hypothetical protein
MPTPDELTTEIELAAQRGETDRLAELVALRDEITFDTNPDG